jgi:hypothetical protein
MRSTVPVASSTGTMSAGRLNKRIAPTAIESRDQMATGAYVIRLHHTVVRGTWPSASPFSTPISSFVVHARAQLVRCQLDLTAERARVVGLGVAAVGARFIGHHRGQNSSAPTTTTTTAAAVQNGGKGHRACQRDFGASVEGVAVDGGVGASCGCSGGTTQLQGHARAGTASSGDGPGRADLALLRSRGGHGPRPDKQSLGGCSNCPRPKTPRSVPRDG